MILWYKIKVHYHFAVDPMKENVNHEIKSCSKVVRTPERKMSPLSLQKPFQTNNDPCKMSNL